MQYRCAVAVLGCWCLLVASTWGLDTRYVSSASIVCCWEQLGPPSLCLCVHFAPTVLWLVSNLGIGACIYCIDFGMGPLEVLSQSNLGSLQ